MPAVDRRIRYKGAKQFAKRQFVVRCDEKLKIAGKALQHQNLFKSWSTDSLLGKAQIFRYPDSDSIKKSGYGVSIKSGVTHSPIDHMPIASLPYNSRMPVYRLHSNDKMPGSNIPVQPNVQVVPQK